MEVDEDDGKDSGALLTTASGAIALNDDEIGSETATDFEGSILISGEERGDAATSFTEERLLLLLLLLLLLPSLFTPSTSLKLTRLDFLERVDPARLGPDNTSTNNSSKARANSASSDLCLTFSEEDRVGGDDDFDCV